MLSKVINAIKLRCYEGKDRASLLSSQGTGNYHSLEIHLTAADLISGMYWNYYYSVKVKQLSIVSDSLIIRALIFLMKLIIID